MPAPLMVLSGTADVVSSSLVAEMMAEARTKASKASSAPSKRSAYSTTASRIDSADDITLRLLSQASAQLSAPITTLAPDAEDNDQDIAWNRSYVIANVTIADQEQQAKQLLEEILDVVESMSEGGDADWMILLAGWLCWLAMILEAIKARKDGLVVRERQSRVVRR